MNENRLRLLVLVVVAAIHAVLLLFVAIDIGTRSQAGEESARVMKLTDIEEAPPPPPEEELPMVESIAETMIETDIVPDQVIVAPGSLTSVPSWDDYLPQHRVSQSPVFDEREILSNLVYPPIAQRSGIEGRVILELFVDKNGLIQHIRILQENPGDRGFGEAAIRAFAGRRGAPAYSNGEPVSSRYRYPVSFRIR